MRLHILTPLLIVLVVSSCSKRSINKAIQGSWVVEIYNGEPLDSYESMTIELNKTKSDEGTILWIYDEGGGYVEEYTGKYYLEGQSSLLIILEYPESVIMMCTIDSWSKNELKFTDFDGDFNHWKRP